MTRPPTATQVPDLLDQVRLDVEHNLGRITPHGREPTTRIGLALLIATETTYGPASANLDPSTTGTGSDVTLTPTEAAAAQRQGKELRDQICQAVADLEASSMRLRLLVTEYVGPIEAQAANARRPITDTDDACYFHALVGSFEPRDRTSDVGGNLGRPIAVCKSCVDRIYRIGRAPSKGELGQHARTGKWPRVREAAGRVERAASC